MKSNLNRFFCPNFRINLEFYKFRFWYGFTIRCPWTGFAIEEVRPNPARVGPDDVMMIEDATAACTTRAEAPRLADC